MNEGSVTNLTAYQIRRLIRQQNLKAGDRLPSERRLGDHLQVSRTSVRAAIAELQAIGLLEVRAKSGIFVAADGSGGVMRSMRNWFEDNNLKLAELAEFREAIEPAAARAAARRRTAEQIVSLQQRVVAMANAADDNDHLLFSENDTEFHYLIAVASGNPLFVLMTESLSNALHVYRGATARLGEAMLRRSLDDHRRILEAIEVGDPSAAEHASAHHVVETAVDFQLISRDELLR